MDEILEELTAEFEKVAAELERPNYWINTHVAKGPIIISWRNQPKLWVIADEKTPGYPSVNFVYRNILTGGNWRDKDDKAPVDTYKRQLEEELGKKWKTRLTPHIMPFADYLEFYSLADHGNPEMTKTLPITKGDVYCIVSVFGSRIEGEELEEELKIPSAKLTPDYLGEKLKSSESSLVVLPLDDLIAGRIDNFAAGDGEKLRDYLHNFYGIGERLRITNPRGKSTQLKTVPSIHYADRETIAYSRINPLREGTTAPQSPFKPI